MIHPHQNNKPLVRLFLAFAATATAAAAKQTEITGPLDDITFLKRLKGLQWQPLSPNVAKTQQKAFVIFVIVVLNIFMSEHGKDELRRERSPQKLGNVAHEIQAVRLR